MAYTDYIHTPRAYTVHVRRRWYDSWVEVYGIVVDFVSWNVAPTLPSARLFRRYGVGLQPGTGVFGPYGKLNLTDWFVRVTFAQLPGEPSARVWHGYIQECDDRHDISAWRPGTDPKPHVPSTQATYQRGEQTWLAYGLECLLARQPITGCWVQDPRRAEDPGQQEVRLRTALEFNVEHTSTGQGYKQLIGNRSKLPGKRGVCIFSDSTDGSDAATWSTRDIVKYLLAYHPIETSIGGDFNWLRFALSDEAMLPDFDTPKMKLEGRTLKQALDDLLNRRVGLGYYVTVNETTDRIQIHPYTFNADNVVTPTGYVIPGNPRKRTLDLDGRPDADPPTVRSSMATRYDQVIVRGAPILCCGTISALDTTIEAGWKPELEVEYEEAASNAADYADLDLSQQQRRNTEYRASQRLERVYAYFNLPKEWLQLGGYVGDGEGGEETWQLFPGCSFASPTLPRGDQQLRFDETNEAAWHWPDLRFERTIPLRSGHDYSGAKTVPPPDITDNTPAGGKWTYRAPFVLMRLPDIDEAEGEGAPRYGIVQKLAAACDIEDTGEGPGRKLNCSVQVQPDAPGLIITVSGGEQHEIATTDFLRLDEDKEEEEEAGFDWRDNLIATVAMKSRVPVEVRYPEDLSIEHPADPLDAARVLLIDVGEDAQLHWLAPQTVVDVADGLLVRSTYGGYIRDDRDRMAELARMAFLWYGQERRALDMSYHYLIGMSNFMTDENGIQLGDLITTLGSGAGLLTINTVVTEIRFDLGDDPYHTRIKTQWSELDVLQISGVGLRAVEEKGAAT